MNDVVLFFACLGLGLVLYAVLQTVGLRAHRPQRLLCYLLAVYLTSAALATILSAIWLRPAFSSHASYCVAATGTIVAGFFAAGLYAFLGPATADRSCTAHFLLLMRRKPGHAFSAEQLISQFDGRVFMEKRFDECLRARLIQREQDRVLLTDKGLWMARLYAAQLSGLRLDQRDEFDDSFQPAASLEVSHSEFVAAS